ncbi:glycosyltransferase family 61 protein [Spirosoma sp.]|uniref:glycosyltransferase family 61 protein n=1 Tax=Spirosoma sp. TaxID=1899569 RepID=UPI002631B469|nr:glycosyltransferase family 61 protein [Spirosoma sp.]MCX6212983.1 glycosyltransferase family 61 protein [Spirosoma sp.]
MREVVRVNMPKNAAQKEENLFEPFLTYEIEKLKVRKLHNVFVSYSGFCIDKNGLVKESHHSYPTQMQNFTQDAMYHYYKSCNTPGNLLELKDDETYLLFHHPWFVNYGHWMCEGILRIWMVRKQAHKMVLLLPEKYLTNRFIIDSLEPFTFKSIYIIPEGKSLLVKKLCLPRIKPVVDSYYYDKLNEIKSFYINYAINVKKIHLNLGEKLYLSRKKSVQRRVQNETDVERIVNEYGFTSLCNEDYTFWEQVAIYANAKYLVSIHGAGMTNMIFMNKNAQILELHKKMTNPHDWHSFAFWYMCEALGYGYYQQLCQPMREEDHFFTADFVVDIQKLAENIATLVSLSPDKIIGD